MGRRGDRQKLGQSLDDTLNNCGDQVSHEIFQFEGEMVSITSKYGNSIQSVIFFSSNYTGARLTLSRFTDENGIIHYRGRILCLQNSDVYELQYLTGTYILLKRNLYDLVNE